MKPLDLEKLSQKFELELSKINSLDTFKILEKKYLGKAGILKKLREKIKDLSIEEKRETVPLIQSFQNKVVEILKGKEVELKKSEIKKQEKEQAEDLNNNTPKIGHFHPITQTIRILNDIFLKMGYSIMDGPEIETDIYCFQNLNLPLDHPAREMQDVMYVKEPNILLRTQTSSIEARVLKNYQPPFKVVCPGKIYRNEKVNKSNHFFFHHYQGFVVVKKTSLKDLFGTINHLFKALIGPDTKIRFRNKYYPEVTAAVGPDILCFNCSGGGCPLCKGVGWIEIGGAGIIHPRVLKVAEIDPQEWMGFAFGLGLDRVAMTKYKITDIRTLSNGNLIYKYHENESAI